MPSSSKDRSGTSRIELWPAHVWTDSVPGVTPSSKINFSTLVLFDRGIPGSVPVGPGGGGGTSAGSTPPGGSPPPATPAVVAGSAAPAGTGKLASSSAPPAGGGANPGVTGFGVFVSGGKDSLSNVTTEASTTWANRWVDIEANNGPGSNASGALGESGQSISWARSVVPFDGGLQGNWWNWQLTLTAPASQYISNSTPPIYDNLIYDKGLALALANEQSALGSQIWHYWASREWTPPASYGTGPFGPHAWHVYYAGSVTW